MAELLARQGGDSFASRFQESRIASFDLFKPLTGVPYLCLGVGEVELFTILKRQHLRRADNGGSLLQFRAEFRLQT